MAPSMPGNESSDAPKTDPIELMRSIQQALGKK
jgi:hypothetical protein